jgi:hypothetical protein
MSSLEFCYASNVFLFFAFFSLHTLQEREKKKIQTPPEKNHLKFSILSFDWITLLQSTKLAG